MIDRMIESAAGDLSEVRERLDATREALQRSLDTHDGDPDEVHVAIARLERIEAEVSRIERLCAGRVGTPRV